MSPTYILPLDTVTNNQGAGDQLLLPTSVVAETVAWNELMRSWKDVCMYRYWTRREVSVMLQRLMPSLKLRVMYTKIWSTSRLRTCCTLSWMPFENSFRGLSEVFARGNMKNRLMFPVVPKLSPSLQRPMQSSILAVLAINIWKSLKTGQIHGAL